VFGELAGSTLGALFGGLPAMAYPANVGILKVTRVASRWVTFTTGLILVILGGFGYFDALLVAIPEPVLSGATTVLFGLIFAGGLEVLGRVKWTQDRMVAAGLPVIAGLGLLFTPVATTSALPNWLGLLVGQPLVVTVVLALGFVMYLGWRGDREPALRRASTALPRHAAAARSRLRSLERAAGRRFALAGWAPASAPFGQALLGKACFLLPITAIAEATSSTSVVQASDMVPRSAISRPPSRPPAAIEEEKTVTVIDWATSAASSVALIAAPMNRLGELPNAKPQAATAT
jgi:hypothetical protein